MDNSRIADWSRLTQAAQYKVASTAPLRASRLDTRLHAFVEIVPPSAVPSTGAPLSRIPYAAKDIFCAPNHRPRAGLNEPVEPIGGGYAEVLRLLDEAGATRMGFTAMTELAYEPSGYNAVCEYSRNPWNLDFVPGGSSSGSAAAVASGTAVVALGSDTGGSIRIPAHCCGITGWKPTWSTVSVAGSIALAPFLDCIGLLARSAADLALAAEVLQPTTRSARTIEKIVVLSDALQGADFSIRRACEDGIDVFARLSVAICSATAVPTIAHIDEHALLVMQAEAARTHAARTEAPGISAILRKRLLKGFAIDDVALAASRGKRRQLLEDFETHVLGEADAAVLPVMPIRTPRYSEVDPSSPHFSGRRLYELSRYCRFVNLLGLPAIALPVGFDDRNLPVGLQMIGRRGCDHDLIALAMRMQDKSDWHSRVPTAICDLVSANLEVIG